MQQGEELPRDVGEKRVQTLFLRHTARLRAYIWAFIPSHDHVDDILHSVFLKITQNAHSYDDSRDFLPWALTIAKHEVFAAAKDRSRLPQSLSPEVIEAICQTAPQADTDEARISLLQECLDTLSPRSRQAIQMRYANSCRPSEIARQLSQKVESIYVTISKARKLLKECVERRMRLKGDGA